VLVNAGSWHVMSLLGITLGHHIPPEWGLGFAGTVTLLAMTGSMLADRATWLPTLVAGAAAVAVGTIIDHARPAPGAAR
jgi:predicted branched-subunit amino acid permease